MYLLVRGWLDNFTDRISVQPAVFVLGFALAFGIAMLTISLHTIRAALGNPVHALRSE